MGELGYEERGRRRGWCWWWGKEGCQAIFYTLLTGHWSTNTIHLGLGQKLSPSKAWYHCNNSVLWACCVFFLMPSHTSKQPYTPDSVDEGEWLSAPLVTTELVQCVIWWNIVNYVLGFFERNTSKLEKSVAMQNVSPFTERRASTCVELKGTW